MVFDELDELELAGPLPDGFLEAGLPVGGFLLECDDGADSDLDLLVPLVELRVESPVAVVVVVVVDPFDPSRLGAAVISAFSENSLTYRGRKHKINF